MKKFELSRGWQLILVVVVAIVVYLNILPNQLVLDDKTFVENWPAAQKFEVGKLINGELPPPHGGVYRPIRSLLYAVYYQLWGENPVGYHLHGIMVITISSLLVYLIIERLFNDRKVALTAGLLFATHPVHTEAISYIAASMEMLGVVFFLAAFWWWLKRGKWWQIWVGLFSALAFFSYEMTLVLPIFIVWTDWLLRSDLRRRWKDYVAVVVPAVVYVGVRVGWLHIVSRGEYLAQSVYHTWLVMIGVVVGYIGLLAWPVNLSYLHQIAPGVESFMTIYSRLESILELSIFDFRVWGSLLIIATSWWLVWKVRGRWPVVTWGVGWFYIALLPVAYLMPQGIAISEKYLFLASVGYVTLLAYGLSKIKDRRLGIAILLFLVLFYGGLTIKRNLDWRDEVTFWQRLVVQHPKSALSYYSLGVNLVGKGDLKGGKVAYLKAVELEPRMAEAYFNLGNIYAKQGDKGEAVEAYFKAYELNPEFGIAKTKIEEVMRRK